MFGRYKNYVMKLHYPLKRAYNSDLPFCFMYLTFKSFSEYDNPATFQFVKSLFSVAHLSGMTPSFTHSDFVSFKGFIIKGNSHTILNCVSREIR